MREYTNKVLELVADGYLDKDELIQQLLLWMSEYDVKDLYESVYSDIFEEDEA